MVGNNKHYQSQYSDGKKQGDQIQFSVEYVTYLGVVGTPNKNYGKYLVKSISGSV